MASQFATLCHQELGGLTLKVAVKWLNEMSKKVKREIENRHKTIPPVQHLCMEVLEILWSYYLLQTLPSELDSDDPLKYLQMMKFVGLLTNDVILRLCKFRDDDSRSLSFKQVFKDLRKRSATSARAENLESMIKRYKSVTQNIENHRNTYIAHLSKRDRTHLKPPIEIIEAIHLSIEITDALSDSQNSYIIEGIDLRKTILGNRA